MISIQYSSISSFLHDSSFYKSLNDEDPDGNIQIPGRCYSANDEVKSGEDFAQLLRVTVFWGLKKIPLGVIRFCESGFEGWADQIKDEHHEQQFAQDLIYIFTEPSNPAVPSESSLVRAIRRERTEIVDYLALSPSEGSQAMSSAAEIGRFDFIQMLHQHGHAWDFNACTVATKGGHLDCLRYLQENGCPWYRFTLQIAVAKSGDLPCLKYLFEEGVPWDHSSNHIAANGNLDMLKFAAENGCVFDHTATSFAAQNGHVESLRYLLYDNQCALCPYALIDACFYGHVACVKLLREHGVELNIKCCIAAANGGHVPVLQYLHEQGCVWDYEVSFIAAKRGHYDVLHYFRNHGHSYSSHILDVASSDVSEKGLKCFKFLIEDIRVPIPATNTHFNEAFARGNYYVVRYLFERDAVYKKHTIIWPYPARWHVKNLNIKTDAIYLAKLDSYVLKCIQCAVEYDWDISACGRDLVEYLTKEQSRLPQSFECVLNWYEKEAGDRKRKEMA